MARELTPFALLGLVALACGGGDEPALPPAAPVVAALSAQDSTSRQDSAATAVDPRLTREAFAYSGGVRDPFVSLLNTASTGPELPDLSLVAVYLDLADARNSVAVLRERINGRRFSLRTGDQIGRMHVARIARQTVMFTIDDFGVERQETLTLRKVEEETQ